MSKLVLIDGHSILNRAFYGLPDLTNAEGRHTGAVFGFLNIMLRLIDEEKPDCLAVASAKLTTQPFPMVALTMYSPMSRTTLLSQRLIFPPVIMSRPQR